MWCVCVCVISVVLIAGTVTEQWCSVSCPCHLRSLGQYSEMRYAEEVFAFFSVDYPLICLWSSTPGVMSHTLGSESSVDSSYSLESESLQFA